MKERDLILFVGVAAVLLVYFGNRNGGSPATTAGASPGQPSAAVGDNPLGAATGTTDANGDPIGGLGSNGG